MIDPRKTVGEIAIERPRATRVFDLHGIDYSCAGERTLAGVCSERDIPVNRLVAEIESASPSSFRAPAKYDDLVEVVDHIVSTHHTFTRAELGRLVPLAEKVAREHALRHAELDRVRELVVRLAALLGPHMDTEESVLFPYFIALEDASVERTAPPRTTFERLAIPIAAMHEEHEGVTTALRELHALTLGHAAPDDADKAVRELYEGLAALERDLREHIHLENNVAFPSAERLERSLVGSG